MSNTSMRPIPTLRGMFSAPKTGVAAGRNFLKENKLSLRSLEKATTEKLAAKEPVRPKWMPPLRRTASEVRDSKRCEREINKPCHQQEQCLMRTNSQQRVAIPKDGEHFDGLEDREPLDYQAQPVAQRRVAHFVRPFSPESDGVELNDQSPRCQSCGHGRSGTSIAVQTEDISDESYLTNALKKCTFDKKSIVSDSRTMRDIGGGDFEQYKSYSQYGNDDNDLQEQPLSARSNLTVKTRRSQYAAHDFNAHENETMPLPENYDLNIGDNYGLNEPEEDQMSEQPLSARSRSTIASNVTSRSKRREHKLGSRDEVRLPRYLEKEKREKAMAVEMEKARDPDCPRGHVLLSEEQRLTDLCNVKKRFDGLVDDLNRMPMTTQTLRVRTRKAEIERELTVLEEEIRVLSKPKVYVRANIPRN